MAKGEYKVPDIRDIKFAPTRQATEEQLKYLRELRQVGRSLSVWTIASLLAFAGPLFNPTPLGWAAVAPICVAACWRVGRKMAELLRFREPREEERNLSLLTFATLLAVTNPWIYNQPRGSLVVTAIGLATSAKAVQKMFHTSRLADTEPAGWLNFHPAMRLLPIAAIPLIADLAVGLEIKAAFAIGGIGAIQGFNWLASVEQRQVAGVPEPPSRLSRRLGVDVHPQLINTRINDLAKQFDPNISQDLLHQFLQDAPIRRNVRRILRASRRGRSVRNWEDQTIARMRTISWIESSHNDDALPSSGQPNHEPFDDGTGGPLEGNGAGKRSVRDAPPTAGRGRTRDPRTQNVSFQLTAKRALVQGDGI